MTEEQIWQFLQQSDQRGSSPAPSANERVTEDADGRITEDGEIRIVE